MAQQMAKPKYFKPKSFGFWVQVIASIAALILFSFELRSYLLRPDVVYATREMVAYAVGVEKTENDGRAVVPYIIFGSPPKILGLLVQNNGGKTATDVLVRIPFENSDELIAGWVRNPDRPDHVRMKADVSNYKFDKLIPGDSVTFDIYLKNTESDLAERIVVMDGFGREATHYSYEATIAGDDRIRFNVSRTAYYIFGLLMVAFFIPGVFDRIRKFGEQLLK